MRVFLLVVFGVFLAGCGQEKSRVSVSGNLIVREVVTILYQGPQVNEESQTFTDYAMWVSFWNDSLEGELGEPKYVNGYFAGDQNVANTSANEGSIWEAKLVLPYEGGWNYVVHFTKGSGAALSQFNVEEAETRFTEENWLQIKAGVIDKKTSDFRQKGMLQDVGGRYLQFSGTKEYFLKTGAGSPENILAYADFDGTYDVGGTNFPALGENQLHEFEPHLKDAREGDPMWGEGPNGNKKGAAIFGIANYYEEVGVNAQYLVTMNVEGDGQDVFPWVSHDDPYVFDVSKLAQWQRVFEHFNSRGVLIDMLLTETENESWFEAVDGVEVGKDFADSRKLYYREMVARFGHLNGLVFNLGEENGVVGNSGQDPYRQPTSVEQRLAFAKYIRELDPYNHAIVSHNWPDAEEETYGPKQGSEFWSGISLQAHHSYAEKVKKWSSGYYVDDEKLIVNKRPWMVTVDEPLGWEFGAKPDSDVDDHRREIEGVLWPTLLAGGAGVDWYFGWQNNAQTSDLSNEDQRSRHELWLASKRVKDFFQDEIELPTLQATLVENGTLVAIAKDEEGRDVKFTLERRKPKLPEGGGHQPWEYEVEGLAFERDGKVIWLDLMNPELMKP